MGIFKAGILTLGAVAALGFFTSTAHAAALAGSDTTPGDSCAGIPSGATRMVADPDGDGTRVTLICDGTTWNQEGIVVLSKTGAAPTADGTSIANLSEIGDVTITTPSDGDALTYQSGVWVNQAGGGGGGSSIELIDADADTWVRVMADDGTTDTDIIRFSVGGNTIMGIYDGALPAATVGAGLFVEDPSSTSLHQTRVHIKNSSSTDGEASLNFGNTWGTARYGSIGTDGTDSQVDHTLFFQAFGNRDIKFNTAAGEVVRIDGTNPFVGINDANPSAALDVVGDINYTGVLVDVSDRSQKTDIRHLRSVLSKMHSIHGVSFVMKNDPKRQVELGLIAQDVEAVYPQLVHTDPQGIKSLNYTGMIGPLVEAVKELDMHNGELARENAELRRMVQDLSARMDVLEGKRRPKRSPYND